MEKTLLEYIVFFAELIVFFTGIYYLGISFFSFATPVLKYKDSKNHKFAVLVAAHNEENVISGIIKSLKAQTYSIDMFDVFVIADNCTDKTAEIARSLGVGVIERFDETKKGKGYALEYAFDYIFSLNNGSCKFFISKIFTMDDRYFYSSLQFFPQNTTDSEAHLDIGRDNNDFF